MFRWGVENEMEAATVLLAVSAVPGQRIGRSSAIDEADPEEPVPPAHIEAIQPYVNRFVWGMIQLQLVSGMRPGETRLIRMRDIDMTDEV